MNTAQLTNHFFIGWDVGGWNCDKNGKSRDAIVILDSTCQVLGTPWRGNLRESIAHAEDTRAWLSLIFGKCKVNLPEAAQVVMAIDTPLGFPEAFLNLAQNLKPTATPPTDVSGHNPYLFRQTEIMLFDRKFTPLSAIKDMIGSQATKGMHVLAKFAPIVESCGVWSDKNKLLRAIETYPAVCEKTEAIENLLKNFSHHSQLQSGDKKDAVICALIAYLFAQGHQLEVPDATISPREGWIWMP